MRWITRQNTIERRVDSRRSQPSKRPPQYIGRVGRKGHRLPPVQWPLHFCPVDNIPFTSYFPGYCQSEAEGIQFGCRKQGQFEKRGILEGKAQNGSISAFMSCLEHLRKGASGRHLNIKLNQKSTPYTTLECVGRWRADVLPEQSACPFQGIYPPGCSLSLEEP